MPKNKNKNRLYIILQHRDALPGFHWTLILAPKCASANLNTKDSHLFHVTNTLQPNVSIGASGNPDWCYEHRPVNTLDSNPGRPIARILVAKLPATEPLETQADQIDGIVRRVPLVQGDKAWKSRVWVGKALMELRDTGSDFSTIPEVVSSGQVEGDIKVFGNIAKASVLGRRKPPMRESDIPQADMRVR